jgi:iron-sulfur cluster repair protein YtfE (RIC family)
MAGVHNVFRSSLSTAPGFIASAAGQDERRAMIANYYANLMAFLSVHHEGEEQIVFPLLMERAPDSRSIVEQGASQHEDVVELMLGVNESIESWAANGDSEAEQALRYLQSLDAVLSPHLDQEEAEIVPLAAEYLSAEEWGMLPGHAMGSFQGDKIWLIMGLIRENFSQDQRDAMLENMPPPARDMWQNIGESSFNELIAQVRQV